MKNILISLTTAALLSSFASALTLDKDSAKVDFIGYKMANKVAAPGTFNGVEFKFTKLDGELSEILTGAKAKIDFNKIDTIKNPVRDKNIKTKLVANMKTPEIDVEFKEVKGNNQSGEITASVNMNEMTKDIPLKYEVKDGVLKVTGTVNMDEFMHDAFELFRNDKLIQGLHGKKTFPEVDIIFEANVK